MLAVAPLLAETKVLAIAGSTRADSYNKKLVKEASEIAREMGAKVIVVDLNDFHMPFYDADFERREGMPANAKRLRSLMMSSDAIIIASPEYNASIPAVLKNAIDWASRSEDGKGSHDAFKGKKFAIMSASPGRGGGVRGLAHLRSIIEDVGGEVLEKQVTIPRAHTSFTADGNLESSATKEQIKEELADLIPTNVKIVKISP